jgi:hypothetical protein
MCTVNKGPGLCWIVVLPHKSQPLPLPVACGVDHWAFKQCALPSYLSTNVLNNFPNCQEIYKLFPLNLKKSKCFLCYTCTYYKQIPSSFGCHFGYDILLILFQKKVGNGDINIFLSWGTIRSKLTDCSGTLPGTYGIISTQLTN